MEKIPAPKAEGAMSNFHFALQERKAEVTMTGDNLNKSIKSIFSIYSVDTLPGIYDITATTAPKSVLQ